MFGLLDGFIVTQRWPSSMEWIGSFLQIAGVVLSIGIFTRQKTAPVMQCEGEVCRSSP